MPRAVLAHVVLLGALAWSGESRAACARTYTGDELVADLRGVQLALRSLDEEGFAATGRRLEAGIPCLGGTAPAPVFASAYRYVGAWYFLVAHDEAKARRWFRTALEIDPTYAWDASELDLAHPMRSVFEQERPVATAPPQPIAGKVVSRPAGSQLLIDGRPLEQAEATIDRPHLVQQIGNDRSVRGSWLVDGNAVPAQFLMDEALPLPAGSDGPATAAGTDDYAVQRVERVRPREKTPLLVSGAIGIAGAGGLYAASLGARARFDAATTTEGLEDARALTNALVLTSGGVLLAGLGVSAWGVLLDGGAGFGLVQRF